MYYRFDMSEYMINVYIASDNQYKSVIEIRRSNGDTFVHDEFFRCISKCLEEKNVLEHKDEENEVDFNLEPLSLGNLDLSALGTLDDDCLKDLASLTDESVTSEETIGVTSAQQLGDELIEVVTDRSSYREVFRHSSGVLCQELQVNEELVKYVVSQKNIIQRLIKPLTEDLYDTLIIRNILEVVKQLLQHQNSKVLLYDNIAKDIRDLKQKWAEGVEHQIINIRFARSQQVEKACIECLDLLQKRF